MSLKSELEKRVIQLAGRRIYTEDDMKKLEKEIDETRAAISGINQWEKDERNLKLLELPSKK